jgi:hypothetical protein
MVKRVLTAWITGLWCILCWGGGAFAVNEAIYHPESGRLTIPRIAVGSQALEAELQLAGPCFVVNSVSELSGQEGDDDIFGGPDIDSTENQATFDVSTGALHIPKVVLYPSAWEVDMVFTGACFEITAMTPVPLFYEPPYCDKPLGDPDYCFTCGPCAEGEGGCNRNWHCQTGLVCDLTTNTCVRP